MDDFSVPVLVDAKAEYTKQIIDILKPHLYDGIRSIYKDSVELCEEYNQREKILITFQNLLSNVPKWSQEIINNEYDRIINNSGCDWLDDLLTAVFISHTKILTAIRIGKHHKKINLKVPKIDHFIHRVYIQMAREFWKTPFLFDETINTTEYQRNMKYCEDIISNCIQETIRQQLPVKHILKEYLEHDEEDEEIESFSDLDNKHIKKLVKKEIDNFKDINLEQEQQQQEGGKSKETDNIENNKQNNLEKVEEDSNKEKMNLTELNLENGDDNKEEIKLEEINLNGDKDNKEEINVEEINLDSGDNHKENNLKKVNLEGGENHKEEEINLKEINLENGKDNKEELNLDEGDNHKENDLKEINLEDGKNHKEEEINLKEIKLDDNKDNILEELNLNGGENNEEINLEELDLNIENKENELEGLNMYDNNSGDLLTNLDIPSLGNNINLFSNNDNLEVVDVDFNNKKEEYEKQNNISSQVLEEFNNLSDNNNNHINYDKDYNFFSDAEEEI